MKLLIGLVGCSRYEVNGWNDVLRETSLKDAESHGLDCRVFIGDKTRGLNDTFESYALPPMKDDIVVLPCADDYNGILWKVREIFKWFLKSDNDFIFHFYHDTYFSVERLLTSGFENYELAGLFSDIAPFGGPGIFVSRKAAQIYVDEIQEESKGFRIKWNGAHPSYRAQVHTTEFYRSMLTDLWLGMLVRNHNLPMGTSNLLVHSQLPNEDGPLKSNQIMTCHLSTIQPYKDANLTAEQRYTPEYMLRMYREYHASWGEEKPTGYDAPIFRLFDTPIGTSVPSMGAAAQPAAAQPSIETAPLVVESEPLTTTAMCGNPPRLRRLRYGNRRISVQR